MSPQTLSYLVGASLLLGACSGATSAPNRAPYDAGGAPVCPAGPNSPTASSATLPSGACQADEGPCPYQATPCPTVKNGAVNGYTCACASGTWSCEVVNQSGLCSPLPNGDGGVDGAPPATPDAAPPGPTGPGGPNQP